ncbi:colanic acid biosynthesis glycosyltransferase WcaI [Mariprofundus sp. EBB-1]|uniref:glycosyltransferase WbuB n=1 Tax=Mariprofundus sp. EBB-1 TaxID=2650971 RepID=UPI000EF180DC|nr:glycosyltransferase WbuB [Mariprofundus sp. EBB-1]RLL50654.1 colanic acid biosynthesis glycosyltransferase WcaI [Mariprofundus sp. EBB-1]
MRILIYSTSYAPEMISVGKYNAEMAEWLVEQGHKVRVVTAPPYFPAWSISAGYSNRWYSQETLHGAQVWRCPLFVPAKPSGRTRLLHLISFALSSFPVMLRQVFWKPDIVMVTEPALSCVPAAWLAARLSGARSWLHIQDFEVDAAFKLGMISNAWGRNLLLSMERWLMHRFDLVSTISSSMQSRLRIKGIEKPFLFPNWSDLSRIQFDLSGRQRIRHELDLDDQRCLCLYSGNIAEKQGLEIILDVAKKLPECLFVICGDGATKPQLKMIARKSGATNILFIPLKPLEELPALLSAADIHLVIQKRAAADLLMPSKLTNILGIGGAAIVTADKDTELGRLAEGDSPAVFRCAPESAKALQQAIEFLKNQPELRSNIGGNAKKYAKQHIEKEQVLSNMMKQINTININKPMTLNSNKS